jgi:putative transposase
LLGVPRASYYYKPIPETKYNLLLMSEIDKQYLSTPSYGSRLMTAVLRRKGYQINRKRVSRLMREIGLEAMYPKPKRQAWEQRYGKFPYLLKNIDISYQNHVWGTDITYIPVENGYVYLVAFVDLYSRFVLSWELSNSLESKFCVEAMKNAFKHGKPLIINSDQGVQFTSHEYISILKNEEIAISMSGKGRCWDNIFVERFWRTIKYEEIYLKQYTGMEEAYEGIDKYIKLYNSERPHSSLNNKTPSEVYGRLLKEGGE